MKKEESIKPVHITKDIWFYPTEKTLEFVVWGVCGEISDRQAVQFEIPLSKLRKYLIK